MRIAVSAVLVLFLVGCGAGSESTPDAGAQLPTVGTACGETLLPQESTAVCDGARAAVVCEPQSRFWRSIPCKGQTGCSTNATGVVWCDWTGNAPGEPCPWAGEGTGYCSPDDSKLVLVCKSGAIETTACPNRCVEMSGQVACE